jgi:hypothetical protein
MRTDKETPFALSLSKDFLSSSSRTRKGKGFDRLSPIGVVFPFLKTIS